MTWLQLDHQDHGLFVSDEGKVLYSDRPGAPRRLSTTLGVYTRVTREGRWIAVAELVLRAHFGAPIDGELPIHINGNLFDNRITNLRWSFPDEPPEVEEKAVAVAIVRARTRTGSAGEKTRGAA